MRDSGGNLTTTKTTTTTTHEHEHEHEHDFADDILLSATNTTTTPTRPLHVTFAPSPLPGSQVGIDASTSAESAIISPATTAGPLRRSPRQSLEMSEPQTGSGSGSGPSNRWINPDHIRGGRNGWLSASSRADSLTRNSIHRVKTGLFAGVARHTLGLLLLLCVVFLWTLSNFLGSSIFANAAYPKPLFLTYLNTSMFVFAMVPSMIKWMFVRFRKGTLSKDLGRIFSGRTFKSLFRKSGGHAALEDAIEGEDGAAESEAFLKPDSAEAVASSASSFISNATQDSTRRAPKYLGLLPTARLSLAFCILWFGANYFAMACLQYTTVASTTILTSTSSVWTLLIGACTGTEKFTWRKLCGVFGSLLGIALISRIDLSSSSPPTGSPASPPADGSTTAFSTMIIKRALEDFPDKPAAELALGDALALLSAVVYGFYTITLKKSTIKAAPLELHMPTFFSLVGLFNIFLLLPLFPIFHFTGIESFQFPPTRHIWVILIVNSISSLASDIMWAYAMVLTSPLVVTVGLSLTIPLSLIGEMILQARYEGWLYWIGAMVVVGSFIFVERQEQAEATTDEEGNSSSNSSINNDTNRDIAIDIRIVEEGGEDTTNRIENENRDENQDEETEEDTIRDRFQRRINGDMD